MRSQDEKREDRTQGRAYLPNHLVRVNDAAKPPRSVILPTQLAASGLPSTCKPSPDLRGAVARTSQVPMISLCT